MRSRISTATIVNTTLVMPIDRACVIALPVPKPVNLRIVGE
jgi:hypothetical protein